MSREDYINGIIEIINAEPDGWVINQVYRFVVNMTAKGGAA